ncbi:MAG TPA: coagulation factor 5/8 type domain-containing protein, partial [Bacteroidota bacterium]
ADGKPDSSYLLVRYTLRNVSPSPNTGSFYIALRPFQVNPTYQWLNTEGGFAKTVALAMRRSRAVAGGKSVIVSGQPDASGVTSGDQGDIVEYIARGRLPSQSVTKGSWGTASGAFGYSFTLAPGDSLVVVASVPFWPPADRWTFRAPSVDEFDSAFARQRSEWVKRLNAVRFDFPDDAAHYFNTLRSNLAYILINKDGPGFQPGSRSYERSWIRDGSMTSSALLKFGMQDDVRRFIDWYSSYQYDNGMVPCVVDERGPDPVPENDSHGEYIFACMEYYRFTHDAEFLRRHWSNIESAVRYIQDLRKQRMTKEYRDGDSLKRACYGLVPESISHEGYSAKPMHSYWDDFFVLKGLKDASAAAAVLGKDSSSRFFDSVAHAFRSDLYRSMQASMRMHGINYIPGCVELGDFDPTSTSIALFPCDELKSIPDRPIHNTFDRYFEWFTEREKVGFSWDAFTPYELRNVGTYIYLGQKQRALTLLNWFFSYQRPTGWNQWAEVVWHDPRKPAFIGDMPHTWVGSDFINALRAAVCYEIDDDTAIVIAAGLPERWILNGIGVEGLPTHYGTLSYSIKGTMSSSVTIDIRGDVHERGASILIPAALLSTPVKSASVNGTHTAPERGFIRVKNLPARIALEY